MLEIKFEHKLNVQRYTWHARLPDNAVIDYLDIKLIFNYLVY